MGGILYFDPQTHQLIQTHNEMEKAYFDPQIQLNRHKSQLEQWLNKNKLPDLPILSLVVFSNPTAILRTSPDNKKIFQKIIHRDYLPTTIEKLEKKNQEEVWSDKEIKKATRLLLKQNDPLDRSLLEKYNIKKEELLKGVHCPKCEHLPLIRIHGSWHCKVCNLSYRDAHVAALKDYSLLISSTIKNDEARDFLRLSSPSTAKRLLQSLNLETSGGNKNKTYHLFFEDK